MVRAICRAASRPAAPVTSIRMTCVAPSPSSAISRASDSQTAWRVRPQASRPAPCRGPPPAAPLARKSTVSFVLMWPSTLTQLKVSSAAAASSRWASSGSRAASVITTPSMVASLGPIIAAPFAIPNTVQAVPSAMKPPPAILGRVSVVIIPRAAVTAACSSSPSTAAAAAIPCSTVAIGRNSPMMPVDITSMASPATPSSRPATSAIRRASSSPRLPVQALAFPELITTPRRPRPGVRERSSATGAAYTRLVV